MKFKRNKPDKTQIKRNESYLGESIEQKIRRILNNKEPIKDGAPLIYTERKDGVRPEYNVRTDRWELAIDEMEAKSKSHRAKRSEAGKKTIGEEAKEGMNKEIGGAKTTETTE